MAEVTLVIGSKQKSSWSLRPWLFLRHHGLAFREVMIELDQPQTRERILRHSPSGRVPVLVSDDYSVWESLAICEFAAEWFALPGAWPMQPAARAMARSIAHEMHAGFADLRRELPFDTLRNAAPVAMSVRAQADIARIRGLWREARTRFGAEGPWLFGRFGIVDAMYAPVALRFQQYAVAVDGPEREYCEAVTRHAAVEVWVRESAA
jgi:glutathione S-transferase